MAFRKHLSGQKGFTLIELLVVVAILGILAGIAAPRVMDAINNARARKAEADQVVIRDALERFYLDFAVFPPNLQWLVEEGYLDPNTTFTNSYNNRYTYVIALDTDPAAPRYFTDYRLGDPGRTPDAWVVGVAWVPAGKAALPQGIALDAAPNAATTCYYWADAAGGHGPAFPIAATFTSISDTTRVVTFNMAVGASFLFYDSAAAPVPVAGDGWRWSYQGQQ